MLEQDNTNSSIIIFGKIKSIFLSASVISLSQYKLFYWSDFSYVLVTLMHTQNKVFQLIFKSKFDRHHESLIVFNKQ